MPLTPKVVHKGGRVVYAGIHKSGIPSFRYQLLWEKWQLASVASLTQQDGIMFLRLAQEGAIVTQTSRNPLRCANGVFADLRVGRFAGFTAHVPYG